MSRHEVKFVGAENDLPRVLAELQMMPGAPRSLHRPRVVQSIYFDTADGEALQDNLAGISRRRKLRFRWYGPQGHRVTGQLEWKARDNLLGTKDVEQLARTITVEGTTRRELQRELRAAASARFRARLDPRGPVQWIRYHRRYFTTGDRRLRVTVDTGIAATDLRYGFVISRRRATPLPRLLVLEVKAASEYGDEIDRWAQHLGLSRSRCSKFVLASAPGEAPLPSRYS